MPRNVLIFHNAAMGDFVLTWPLAMALGRLLAQSRIIYVTASEKGELAQRVLGVEWRDADAGWHALHGASENLPEPCRKLLSAAQLVVSYAQTPNPAWDATVREIAPDATVLHIRPNLPTGEGSPATGTTSFATTPTADARTLGKDAPTHVTRHQLQQLKAEPAILSFAAQALALAGTTGVAPRTKAVPGRVVIAPGSGSAAKNWPVAHFVELATRLTDAGREVIFVTGEVEANTWSAQALHTLAAAAPVRRPRSLLDLHDLLASATTFIGNDSGPTHLAAMLGVATLALFGPTDPRVWHPIGPTVRVLACNPLADLPLEAVAEAAFSINQATFGA